MQSSMRVLFGCSLVLAGYVLGASYGFRPALAQNDDSAPTDDAIKKIVEANDALKKAGAQLTLDGRYTSVTKSVNPYSVLAGGLNAKDDLDAGHGVDPDTFAALNLAAYELKKNRIKDESLADWVDTNLLGYDNEGRLTYRNKVVRLYSVARLRKLNVQRMLVLGEIKEQKAPK